MTITQIYVLRAQPGAADALVCTLRDLAALVAPLPGCDCVEIAADASAADTYAFIERWQSEEDRLAGGAALGKEAFKPLSQHLAAPPEALRLRSL